MPKAKSRSQASKFGALYSQGKITKKELSTRTKGLKLSKLPTKVKRKKGK
jgi:hypothetical protein